MGVRRVLGGGLALLALALVAPSVAAADETLAPSGELVYTWHGDPARGCAAVGVCGVVGALIVHPSSPSFLMTPGHGIPAMLDLTGGSAAVRVRRTGPGSSGDCLDADAWPNAGDGMLTVSWQRDGSARLIIPSTDGPSSGRCAGPLSDELGAVLHGHTNGGTHPSFSFAATSSFTAGPFSGTLRSTLGFRPDAGAGESFSSGSGSGSFFPPGPGGAPKTAPFEQVTLRIRLSALPATLGVSFHGNADPACVVFDACATSGTIGIGLAASRSVVTVIAQRRVSRPVSRARALADFRAGRLTVQLGFNGSGAIVRTSEAVDTAGAAACSEALLPRTPVQVWVGSLFQPTTGPWLPVLITAQDGTMLLRTHCPGPTTSDIFNLGAGSVGNPDVLARGSITATQLLQRHATVKLGAHGAFTSLGYSGTRTGSVDLSLSLLKVQAGTVREPIG